MSDWNEYKPIVFQTPRKSMHSISMRCGCGLTCSLPFEIFEERYVEALEKETQLLKKILRECASKNLVEYTGVLKSVLNDLEAASEGIKK